MSTKHSGRRLLIAGTLPVAIAIAGAGVASADPGPVPPPTPFVERNSPFGERAMPDQSYLAPFTGTHGPVPVAPVAPIAPPPGKIRIGDVQLDTPYFLNPQQSKQVNDATAGAEAQIATFGDSVGLDPTRSDRVAAATLGDAAIGGAAGALTVGLPFVAVGGFLGGIAGFMVGVPFFPAGLVWGPALGATIGASATGSPFIATGAAIGAAAGATRALNEPAHGAPPAPQPVPPAPNVR